MDLCEAIAFQREGRWAEAERVCRSVLAEQCEDNRALHLLGSLALRQGRTEEAIDLLTRAVRLAPAEPRRRVDLATALGKAGRPTEALDHLNAALVSSPQMPELHNNLGVTLEKLSPARLPEAADAYRNAIDLRPDYAEAHHNLGNALRKMNRLAESAAAYRKAVELKGDYLKAVQGLANVLGEAGELEEVITCLRRLVDRAPRFAAARSSLLYTLHYSPEYGAEALYREHREWGRLFCDPLKGQIRGHENDRSPDRRLRVGYVSPDFREHTVPHFVTAALEHHDREHFERFCYSDVEKPDAITRKLQGLVEHWHGTRGKSDLELEQLIRADRIDILVDLRGHAADNRLTLFARKPAPIQVNMVGYFDTTGLSTMDYRITDQHMDPPGQTEHLNTERLIRMEPSCWCYTPEAQAPQVAEPPAVKQGFITFGSLNKIVKVSRPCAMLWSRVLESVPRSRLLLSVTGGAAEFVRERLAFMGLPVDRLDILDKARGAREYLERFHQIDIALDTFPFNGITTTCDGLWMGVPCVSLAGRTSVSRAGKSILHAANLPELATDTPEAFVRAAVEFASDLNRLRELRLGMRQRLPASALMDHRAFARNLESAYRQMWRAWCG